MYFYFAFVKISKGKSFIDVVVDLTTFIRRNPFSPLSKTKFCHENRNKYGSSHTKLWVASKRLSVLLRYLHEMDNILSARISLQRYVGIYLQINTDKIQIRNYKTHMFWEYFCSKVCWFLNKQHFPLAFVCLFVHSFVNSFWFIETLLINCLIRQS